MGESDEKIITIGTESAPIVSRIDLKENPILLEHEIGTPITKAMLREIFPKVMAYLEEHHMIYDHREPDIVHTFKNFSIEFLYCILSIDGDIVGYRDMKETLPYCLSLPLSEGSALKGMRVTLEISCFYFKYPTTAPMMHEVATTEEKAIELLERFRRWRPEPGYVPEPQEGETSPDDEDTEDVTYRAYD